MVLSSKQVMIKTVDGGDISIGMKRQHSQISHVAQSEPLNCPRCDSVNTKFCYYNNYNKSQPRHFCRACKRHWTKGGTLRNVPVGGGRKNKRLKKSPEARHVSLPPDIRRRDLDDHDDKSVSEILYQAMLIRPNNPTTTAPPPPPPVSSSRPNAAAAAVIGAVPSPASLIIFPHSNQTLNFSAASSPFESGSCLSSMSNSIQNNVNNGGCDYGELNGVVSNQQPWKQLVSNINSNGNNNNNGFDYNNYNWNFEDIDTLVSADHINLAWEDSLDIIKP